MAETAVSFVLGELYPILNQERYLLGSIHKEFSEIKYELESIQAFLKDADKKAAAADEEANTGIRTWVKQVREASFRVEDVIDEYLRLIHGASICKIISRLNSRHRIATEIQDIKKSLSLIKERRERYKFEDSQEQPSSSRCHDPRMGSHSIEETEIVGFEKPRDELVGWLLNGTEHRKVISVVGMGGLGKTTLAKHVFDDENVKSHFDCRVCITVSQSYSVKGLMIDMIQQLCRETNDPLPQSLHGMDEKSLISQVRQYLEHKRYLIFFDDVWHEDFCGQVEFSMPNNNKSSRIIVTTRGENVAEFFKKSFLVHVHKLQPLPQDKAWELFCKKAFRFEQDKQCPAALEGMSNEILSKCKGLPLAIVAIAGLLSTKSKIVSEWKMVSQNLELEFQRNAHLTPVIWILSLSYDDLPYYLKPCILYFGIYPEDYYFHHNRLTRQWIAEGFVMSDGTRTLEKIADEYLSELIYRSLVHVSEVGFEGKVKFCQVHDLIHEVISKKVNDLSFCYFAHKGEQSTTSGITRRLSIDTSFINVSPSSKNSHIRAIHAFGKGELLEHFKNQLSSKSMLKVLELEGTSLDYAPSNLGDLFHLRYLNLRGTNVQVLPKSVGMLHNLETLDVRDTLIHELPSEINKLRKLRHLLAFCRNYESDYSLLVFTTGVKMKKGIEKLTSLQNLYCVEVDHGGIELIQEMKMLKQLRKLGLKRIRREFGNAICASVAEMTHLETLNMSAIDENEIIELNTLSFPPKLRHLKLNARLERMPSWISNLGNLVKMRLGLSNLRDDPLRSLENLPNLFKLSIWDNAYDGENFHFQSGGFPKLKKLNLARLNRVTSILIDDEALPSLETFKLAKMPQLQEISSGSINSLKVIDLLDMPIEFVERINQENGQDHWINHVPLVVIRRWIGPRFNNYEVRTIYSSCNES